ncbi:MAG: PrgI family protein [Minisyncoccia bacterium]
MATFRVPQFIETKPKIIGPLTIEQFAYIGGAGFLIYIIFNTFNFFIAFILSLIIATIGLSFAFVKINKQPLPKLVFAAIQYIWHPKIYTWQRKTQEQTINIPDNDLNTLRKNAGLQSKLKFLTQKITTNKQMQANQNKKYTTVYTTTGDKLVAKKVDY